MKKIAVALGALLCAVGLSTAADAQTAPRDGDGNVVSGWHWNLNIICVPDSNRGGINTNQGGTLFVPCYDRVEINYVLSGDGKFHILDGNALDDGEATIAVPYEYCDDYTNGGCSDLLSYDVYAVGLGKPGGSANVDAECTFDSSGSPGGFVILDKDGNVVGCDGTLLLGGFEISRTNGNSNKPKSVDITKVFRASGCFDGYSDTDVDGCDGGDLRFRDVWIFNIEELLSYWWEYDNHNLKLMQIRFYPTVSGTIEIL